MTMKIAYSKLGRSLPWDQKRWRYAGEAEAINLVYRLAKRNPGVEWHVIGKGNGQPDPAYPNIISYWREDTPKSAWGVLPGGGGHMCNHCKALASPGTHRLECCAKSRDASDYEDYLADTAAKFDGHVTHLGQHGTSHNFIPKVGKNWGDPDITSIVRPYVWAFNYGGYLVRALNAFGDAHDGARGRSAWLCADPRNYMNGRDIKWPSGLTADEPVLAQYTTSMNGVHERWQDSRTPEELGFDARVDNELWRVRHYYQHCGMDMLMLPDDWETWPGADFSDRISLGIVSTAAYLPRRDFRRSAMINDWVLNQFPECPVYGKWDERSLADIPENTRGLVFPAGNFEVTLGSFKCTAIFPPTPAGAEGMNWCTAKPWQAFAARTVTFMIPPVDSQGWVIPATRPCAGAHQVADGLWSVRDDWTEDELHLAKWLRPDTPDDFSTRVRHLSSSPGDWEWAVSTQHNLLTRRWNSHEMETMIESRLGLR